MPQTDFPRRRRLPLAIRISFILMLAAVLPLLIAVVFSETTARPALINQANNAMQTDALTRIQSINAYLTERLSDAATLSQIPAVQTFLADPPDPTSPTYLNDAKHATYALLAGQIRDKHYLVWSLFYKNGQLALSYPLNVHKQQEAIVLPEYVQAIRQGDKAGLPIISPVYYDPTLQKAYVDIYSPVYTGLTPQTPLLGFMRAKLSLDYIWDIVKQDKGVNNSGSAFILDENGVRIADTRQANLFTAVAPLQPATQRQISQENWYGQSGNVSVQANATLNSIVQGHTTQNTFDLIPNGQKQNYQAARATAAMLSNTTPIVRWNYIVISPSSVVTQTADQQLEVTIIVAVIVTVLAGLIGLWVAGLITRPIRRAVEQIRENSAALNTLAKKQQSASSEQLWVVDSIQVGQQSLQYYTDATRIAAHKLGEVGTELENNWRRQNIETIKQGLQHVVSAANYIEKATYYQGDSSQKLATAIKVTTQVNEQLADGAISATEAASQLEAVVNDLRSVIGQ
ncbi:MAG TPA: cache domain-containing protein [Ktedonobacteraceae bacterium]